MEVQNNIQEMIEKYCHFLFYGKIVLQKGGSTIIRLISFQPTRLWKLKKLGILLLKFIIIIRRHNSGKDPFPLMLNRKKLPKKPILTHYPGMTLKKEDYYGPEDLICGQTVFVHSKECLLFNCDSFTFDWYRKHLGID